MDMSCVYFFINVYLCVTFGFAITTDSDKLSPEIVVSTGKLIGTTLRDGKVHAYLGVPYAVSPIHKNSFKPSIPLTLNKDNIFTAKTWPQRCHTFHRQSNNTDASQDCLKISFLLPAKNGETNFFVIFSNEAMVKSKIADLVKLEVAVAVVHVREGVFGYATLNEKHSNHGISDIITALDFIQTNAPALSVTKRIVLAAEGDVASALHLAFDNWYSKKSIKTTYQLVLLNGHKKLERFYPSVKTSENTRLLLNSLECLNEINDDPIICLRSKQSSEIEFAYKNLHFNEENGAPFRVTKPVDDSIFSAVPLMLAVESHLDSLYYKTENDFDVEYNIKSFENFLSKILSSGEPLKNEFLIRQQLRYQYVQSIGGVLDGYVLWKQSRQILYDKVYHASTAALIKHFGTLMPKVPIFLAKYQVPTPLKTCLGPNTPEYQQPFCDIFYKFVLRYITKGEPTRRDCDPGKPKWPELKSSKRPYFIEIKDDGTIEWDHNFGRAADALWNEHVPFLDGLNITKPSNFEEVEATDKFSKHDEF